MIPYYIDGFFQHLQRNSYRRLKEEGYYIAAFFSAFHLHRFWYMSNKKSSMNPIGHSLNEEENFMPRLMLNENIYFEFFKFDYWKKYISKNR